MKRVLLCLTLLASYCSVAQNAVEKVAANACPCMDNLPTLDSAASRFKKCIGDAMAPELAAKTLKIEFTVEGIRKFGADVYAILPSVCPSIRKLLLEKKTKEFYQVSSDHAASEAYEKGNVFMETGDLEGAIKQYKLAVKKDKKFVMALDNLGICYRQMDNYREAIKYYNQSLEIFPEGNFALLNIGSAYCFAKEFDKAQTSYETLAFLYPDDPEGPFGLGKVALLRDDFEGALPHFCQAHRMYVTNNSPTSKDSEQVINFIFQKMKEANKEEQFRKVVAEFNININTVKD